MKKHLLIITLLACLFTVFSDKIRAQCSGNVLFAENFGGDVNSPVVGNPLPTGVTDYLFNASTDVNDGYYSIRKTTANPTTGGRQFNVWHIGPDHSGTGNMMIVNAAYTAGKFYETKVDNLCAGSKLYFSAWVANLIPAGSASTPLDPILKFEISSATSGTVLMSSVTADIPRFASFTWTQYGFNFSLPAGESSVILRIFNNQVGGMGNDLCLDDIEFTLCGPSIAPVVSGAYKSSNDACAGSNLVINGNVASGFYANTTFQWQFNSGSGWINIPGATTDTYAISNAQPANTGTYRLLVAESGNINSNNCRAVSPLIPINIYNTVSPVLQTNQPLCEKDTLRISTANSALQYSWRKGVTTFPATGNTLTIPGALLSDAGMYTLDVITSGGCSSSASVNMAIQQNQLQRMLPLNTLLCDAQNLTVDASQSPALSYLWNDGTTSPQRIITDAGIYSLVTKDAVCKRTDSFTVTRNFTPTVTLGVDTTLCFNEELILNASHPLAEDYLWSNGSSDSTITVTAAGTYSVAVSNKCGVATDDITIAYTDCADVIFVPNAFTPNDDQLNDVLKAKAFFQVQEFNFKIFDRWGKLIFTSSSLSNGWDGKIKSQQAPPGMYTWVIQYKRSNKVYNQKGTVLLIY